MKLKFTAILTAAVLSSALLLGCKEETKMVDLGVVAEKDVSQTLSRPDKPTFSLVIGEDCQVCQSIEKLLQQVGGVRPDVKFVKIDKKSVGTEAGNVIFSYPGLGVVVYGKPTNLTTTKSLVAFIDSRVAGAKNYFELITKAKALNKQLDEMSQPFDDRVEAVMQRGRENIKTELQKVEEIEAKMEETRKPFDQQIAEIRKKMREALAPLNSEHEAAESAVDTAFEPYRAEVGGIQDEKSKALKDLSKELQKYRAEAYKLRDSESTSLSK